MAAGEWIPMGANNIVSLNDRLGSYDRCQARPPRARAPFQRRRAVSVAMKAGSQGMLRLGSYDRCQARLTYPCAPFQRRRAVSVPMKAGGFRSNEGRRFPFQ